MKLLLCLLLCSSGCLAQEAIRFKHIVRGNGSSITGVQSFHQDKEGYIWMASPVGDLIRFDGTNFRYYGSADFEPAGVQGGRGTLVFEDSRQQLWVGTSAGLLFRYDRMQDQFVLATDSSQSAGARIFCVTEGPDGSFWLGSLGGGLIRFHPETKTFKHYKAEKGNINSLPDNFVSGLGYDASGTLWIGTTGGLCMYRDATDTFVGYRLTNVNSDDPYRYRVIRSLLIEGDKIYLSTYGGLQIFDLVSKTSQHFIHHPDNKSSLSHNSVFCATADTDGKIWIATFGGGLNRFDPTTQTFAHWKNDAFFSESLRSNNLFSVYVDNNGLLWVGASDNTVSILNTRAKKFHSVKSHAGQPNGISQGWVRSLLQENDSIFWLGFNGQGLNRLNLNTGQAEKFLHDSKNSASISHNTVSGLSLDEQGDLWIALEGGGINRYDRRTKKFIRYLAGKNSINNNAISALLVDRDNFLWATAYRDGLNLFDIQGQTIKQINNDSLRATGISLDFVDDIFELNGNIWFNAQNQVVVFDKTQKRFVKVADAGRVAPIDNPFFLEIEPYSETEMLLITRGEARAIRYVNPDSIQGENLFTIAGTDDIKSFVIHNKEVWYITYNQLVRWNPKTRQKHTYTGSDGIANDELNAVYKDRQGRIFVTSLNGFNWFYPNQIVDDTVARKIIFTDFKLFNQSASPQPDSLYDFSLPGEISQVTSVRLKHRHSFFSIEFAAQEFIAPEKIQYAYRLRGFDNDWVYVGNRTFASYTNLDPGHYTFEVKSTNPDGYWTATPRSLSIVIDPPYWRTGWFIALAFALVGFVLYSVHRFRLGQGLKLERLRTKIASDLHDEVGSSLTKVSLYAELAQRERRETEKTAYLNAIGGLSREVVATMSDIVWSIDNNNDSLYELVNRMKDFATEVLNACNIEFEFSLQRADINKKLDPVLRQNIYLIFKEAVHNIVKHSQASKVSVVITTQPQFKLLIKDNGIGLPEQQTHPGNGLRNMKRRASAIGAEIVFVSNAGTGITLTVAH